MLHSFAGTMAMELKLVGMFNVVLIEDRRQAIVRAIGIAGPGDIVLIAGKGHETYQLINAQTLHFDDGKWRGKRSGKK